MNDIEAMKRKLNRSVFPARLFARYAAQKAGLSSSRPKVFFIGYNKTGTKSLTRLFLDSGYLPAHSMTYMAKRKGEPPFAKRMKQNLEAGRPLLEGVDHHDAYMDMISLTHEELIEANQWFRELDAQYPGAYFIFNDRPVEKWVRSRLKHEGGPRGSFVKRYASAMKIPEAEVPDDWRRTYAEHKAAVEKYFAANPRFMRFEIETGDPQQLCDFLARDYRLDPRMWGHYGRAEFRHLDKKARRNATRDG